MCVWSAGRIVFVFVQRGIVKTVLGYAGIDSIGQAKIQIVIDRERAVAARMI